MRKFTVSNVAAGVAKPRLDVDAAMRSLLLKPVEALVCDAPLVSCDTMHAFVKAAHDAFYDHHPLVIRPDDVWFCILQGFANHVAMHTEALRGRLVAHDGKKTLVVERPDFFLGQPNPWPEMFDEFSRQIGDHVGPLRELTGLHFSTSTPTEIASFDICLMDAFQGYFDYVAMCGCGIPEITLMGTPADWRAIRDRLPLLAPYDLDWWLPTLGAVLDRLVATAEGDVDVEFWRSFFRYESGSGGSELTGWILALFPYLKSWKAEPALIPNAHLSNWQERLSAANARSETGPRCERLYGPDISSIPGSLASAPVRFIDMRDGSKVPLRFVGGMFGVTQRPEDGALAPAFGWAVVHDVHVEPPKPSWMLDAGDIDEVTGLTIAR